MVSRCDRGITIKKPKTTGQTKSSLQWPVTGCYRQPPSQCRTESAISLAAYRVFTTPEPNPRVILELSDTYLADGQKTEKEKSRQHENQSKPTKNRQDKKHPDSPTHPRSKTERQHRQKDPDGTEKESKVRV